jgi:hypothetical protein
MYCIRKNTQETSTNNFASLTEDMKASATIQVDYVDSPFISAPTSKFVKRENTSNNGECSTSC